jgi:hypothetical protein
VVKRNAGSFAIMDRLEHCRDLPDLGRGHVAEEVAIPMYDTPLPPGLREELGGALGKPQTCIRDADMHPK